MTRHRSSIVVMVVLLSVVIGAFSAVASSSRAGLNPPGEERARDQMSPVRFEPVDVIVDTGDAPLAAWQLHFQSVRGDVRIVGLEGGEPAIFADPPYSDPQAMQRDEVIIADFSTAAARDLPRGRFRLATIHVQITGEEKPDFTGTLSVAATVGGEAIETELIILQAESGT